MATDPPTRPAARPSGRRGGTSAVRSSPRYTRPTDVRVLDLADVPEVPVSARVRLDVAHLHCAGDLDLLRRYRVAIVGARDASEEGQKRAAKLARGLAAERVVVVSGLAKGIDFAAHRAAIESGGRTIAVIGTPLEKAYPAEHGELQEEIWRHHLLVSQFEPGSRVFPSNFPARNLLMAALTHATVVMEASDTSGSLHQAAECVRMGRPLFIARSVVENAALTWPSRFLKAGDPVYVLDDVEDVLRRLPNA